MPSSVERFVLVVYALVLALVALAVCLAHAQQLAFPTAEGYGRFAQGGRGGKAYNINSLSSGSGTGGSCNTGGCGGTAPFTTGTVTFRDCFTDRFAVGARTCIFRTGGTIDYTNGGTTSCSECMTPVPPYLTIAGQTAPGGGIMMKGLTLSIRANAPNPSHNVIVRHIRVRPGPDPTSGSHSSLKSLAVANYGFQPHDVIFDHVSVGWNNDDATGNYGPDNVTYQWMVISEGLSNSTEGWYGKAGMTDLGGTMRITYHHNLIANMVDRLPYVQVGDVQHVNNVIYNAPGALNVMPWYGDIHLAVVNNYWKQGTASTDLFGRPEAPYVRELCTATDNCSGGGCAGGAAAYNGRCACTGAGISGGNCTTQIYVNGNVHNPVISNPACPHDNIICWGGDNSGNDIPSYTTIPAGFPAMPTLPSQTDANTAYTNVLAKAGAYRTYGTYGGAQYAVDRSDIADTRARTDTTNGTGVYRGESIAAVQPSGYETYAAGTPYTDTDGDGIADDWETAKGLNPNNAADGPTIAINGYSNLENFINELAGDNPAPALAMTTPLIHWSFDEGAGSTAGDSTVPVANGTLIAAPTWTPSGVCNGALTFNGTTQYVDNAAFNWPASTPITVSMWVKTASGNPVRGAFHIGGLTSPNVGALIPYLDNNLYWDYGNFTTGRVSTSFAAYFNAWTHVVLVNNGTNFKGIYLNGVVANSAGSATAPGSALTGLNVGRYAQGGTIDWFNGSIDEFKLYNVALSAPEILSLYQTPCPPRALTTKVKKVIMMQQ